MNEKFYGNNNAQNGRNRMVWQQRIIVTALVLLLIGLVIASFVSFFQTELAFRPLNDVNIPLIGGLISYAFAFIFQYGQNAALYIRQKFCTGKTLFTIPFLGWDISDKTSLFALFLLFAIVDAATNVIWFYRNVETNTDVFLDIIVKGIGYLAMFAVVFVEEALGWVLDALSKATKEMKEILKWENLSKKSEEKNSLSFSPDIARGGGGAHYQHIQKTPNQGLRPDPTYRPLAPETQNKNHQKTNQSSRRDVVKENPNMSLRNFSQNKKPIADSVLNEEDDLDSFERRYNREQYGQSEFDWREGNRK
jgi:hypothetical protein